MSRIPIDTAEIRALAEILADTGLTEIEVSDGDSRIRVARTPAPVSAMVSAPAYAPAPAATAAAPVAAAPVIEAPLADHPGAVTSPMVGVAYLSAEPGLPPFVSVGQAVTMGQTVLLIEAMKTFNQIKAPRAGTVTRILVASGQPVEYGEVLLVIE
jgi:acetyl-CoA carboxylase biotin carboxyl carrier protein